jgi:hypothetical protein
MGTTTTFGFDATDPEEMNDSGRDEMRPSPRTELSHMASLRGAALGAKLSWSRGHTVPEHLGRGYDAMVAACKREFARYENNDYDENLNGEAESDDE